MITETTRPTGTQAVIERIVDPVIPAVPGEFYGYVAEFSPEGPLYAFMKCRANKSRILAEIKNIPHEIDLLFHFTGRDVWVSSPDSEAGMRILSTLVDETLLNHSVLGLPEITAEEFRAVREGKNVDALVDICRAAHGDVSAAALKPGRIMSVITNSGKHALFLVNECTQTSIKIEACHVLLGSPE